MSQANVLSAIVGPTPGAGHGECFIWSRGAASIVVAIDAGGAASVGKHAAAHKPQVLILSHDDADHIGGAVALIDGASGSLRELWIPAEWAILITQIAKTRQDNLLDSSDVPVSVEEVSEEVTRQIVRSVDGTATDLTANVLSSAEQNLESWTAGALDSSQGFLTRHGPRRIVGWYGAHSVREIIARVRRRAGALIKILNAAQASGLRLRFFSIDLALASAAKGWESAGRPGAVTLANAEEAPHAVAVNIPSGLAYSYALTRLTVQNRRALCTLLWSDATTPNGGVLIWSDTDGGWLQHIRPRGFSNLTPTLTASSAPHHASANPAHDEVWSELSRASPELVVVSAGGQRNQRVRAEYDALKARRCCTWCRTVSTSFQEVTVISSPGGRMRLQQACLGVH